CASKRLVTHQSAPEGYLWQTVSAQPRFPFARSLGTMIRTIAHFVSRAGPEELFTAEEGKPGNREVIERDEPAPICARSPRRRGLGPYSGHARGNSGEIRPDRQRWTCHRSFAQAGRDP